MKLLRLKLLAIKNVVLLVLVPKPTSYPKASQKTLTSSLVATLKTSSHGKTHALELRTLLILMVSFSNQLRKVLPRLREIVVMKPIMVMIQAMFSSTDVIEKTTSQFLKIYLKHGPVKEM